MYHDLRNIKIQVVGDEGVAEYLPVMYETWGLIPATTKKKNTVCILLFIAFQNLF
jgi:hypothetical protein